LAVYAKSKGFRVIIGGDWGNLSTSQLSSYQSQVLQEAAWAQTNHIDQLSLGNEQEYRLTDLSQTQWASFLNSLAVSVRQVYSGKISYETSGDFTDFWVTRSLGAIDQIGINLYCGYSCNYSYLTRMITKFGANRVYVSETNSDMGTGLYENDIAHSAQVAGDAVKLLSLNVPVYFFTYSACGANGVANHWGLYQCNSLAESATAQVLGIK